MLTLAQQVQSSSELSKCREHSHVPHQLPSSLMSALRAGIWCQARGSFNYKLLELPGVSNEVRQLV